MRRLTWSAKRGWNLRSTGAGPNGARDYAWAWIATASQQRHLLVRRNLKDPTDRPGLLALLQPAAAAACHLATLVRVAGVRWPVEEDFRIGKDHFGLDHSQVRLYTAPATPPDPDHRRPGRLRGHRRGYATGHPHTAPPPTSPTETPPPTRD